MVEKKVTISKHSADRIDNVEIGLAYCYATEIAFKEMSEDDINDFIQNAIHTIHAGKMPDIKKTLFLIASSHLAYTESHGDRDVTISYGDLITASTPSEIVTALVTIIKLREDFYNVPSGEPEDKPAPDGSPVRREKAKNA